MPRACRKTRSQTRSSQPCCWPAIPMGSIGNNLDGHPINRCHSTSMEPIQSRDYQGRVADAPSGHWVYRVLPRGLWPYAQLARWDRPIGWQLLLWPCWWSAALAADALRGRGDPLLALLPSPWHLLLFFDRRGRHARCRLHL